MATVLPGVENSLEGSLEFSRENRCLLLRHAGAPGLTVGAKARYAFVYGDFHRIHRMGLIACSYRAAESRHKEIELTADELLQYLDTKSERRRKR
jgi:hypothetical protein